jgi:hypothetical protein
MLPVYQFNEAIGKPACHHNPNEFSIFQLICGSRKISMNSALIPVPKLEDDFYDWHERHQNKCQQAAKRTCILRGLGFECAQQPHRLKGNYR